MEVTQHPLGIQERQDTRIVDRLLMAQKAIRIFLPHVLAQAGDLVFRRDKGPEEDVWVYAERRRRERTDMRGERLVEYRRERGLGSVAQTNLVKRYFTEGNGKELP